MEFKSKTIAIVVLLLIIVLPLVSYADTYEYDVYNRLIKVIYDDGTVVQYHYDENSNIIRKEVTTASENSNSEGSQDGNDVSSEDANKSEDKNHDNEKDHDNKKDHDNEKDYNNEIDNASSRDLSTENSMLPSESIQVELPSTSEIISNYVKLTGDSFVSKIQSYQSYKMSSNNLQYIMDLIEQKIKAGAQ